MLLIRMYSQSYILENGLQIRISLSLTISIAKSCTRSMTKLLRFIRSGKVQFEETYATV